MENIETLIKKAIKNSTKGMSSTILALPGTGKTYSLKKVRTSIIYPNTLAVITIHTGDLPKRTSEYFYNYLLVELSNLLLEITEDSAEIPSDIMQALQINNEALLIATVKRSIKKILTIKKKLLFVVDDLSILSNLSSDFFNSLRNIRFVNKEKISFLFLDNIKPHSKLTKDKVEDLYNYLNESILYLPLPTGEIFNKVYQSFAEEYDLENSTTLKSEIEKLTYGHPSLLKYIITTIIQSNGKIDTKKALKTTGIKDSLSNIANDLSPELLDNLFSPKEGSDETNTLLELGLLRKSKDGTLQPPGLFLAYKDKLLVTEKGRKTEKNANSNTKTNITLKDGIVSVKGSQTKEPLSNREYKILQHFDKHRNKVVSRDELGKVIWGNKVTEEYSEWAIDQSISRLRKKLGDNAYKPEYLKTIRGRGFILED